MSISFWWKEKYLLFSELEVDVMHSSIVSLSPRDKADGLKPDDGLSPTDQESGGGIKRLSNTSVVEFEVEFVSSFGVPVVELGVPTVALGVLFSEEFLSVFTSEVDNTAAVGVPVS